MGGKKDTPGILNDVPPDFYFHAANGTVIKNLVELHTFLKKADDMAFKHHVTKEKNDFANWVRDIIKDEKLADEISKAKSKVKTTEIIDRRIAEEEKKKSKERDEEVKKAIKKAKKRVTTVKMPKISEKKLDDIFKREKRKEKISEIRNRIKKRLENAKTTAGIKFPIKEFIQGLAIGLVLGTILFLAYLRSVS